MMIFEVIGDMVNVNIFITNKEYKVNFLNKKNDVECYEILSHLKSLKSEHNQPPSPITNVNCSVSWWSWLNFCFSNTYTPVRNSTSSPDGTMAQYLVYRFKPCTLAKVLWTTSGTWFNNYPTIQWWLCSAPLGSWSCLISKSGIATYLIVIIIKKVAQMYH